MQAQSVSFIYNLPERSSKQVRVKRPADFYVFTNIENRTFGIKRLRYPDGRLCSRKLKSLSGTDWVHLQLHQERTNVARQKERHILIADH